ncbi:MAG TPA: glycosyltransferase family 2 protein [Allosphingosinicella sp.]|jgi:glycosyltransferase involved in cell wall biosynthesis
MLGRGTRNWSLRQRLREDWRSARDLGPLAPLAFRRARRARDYREAFEAEAPLVSICIATYNRAPLLVGRSIPSALAQSYPNVEVIVVGDHCTDDTERLVGAIRDPRLRFENLPRRGNYPDAPDLRWMVGGGAAMNRGIELARGDFVTHLDDDDEHMPERVEKLLRLAQEARADVVYHPFDFETPDGEWHVNPAEGFHCGRVTTSSIFYHRWLRAIPWDLKAAYYREPGDWNRLRKLRFLGARVARHPDVLLKHYRERNQKSA